jgi:hypothetical protein
MTKSCSTPKKAKKPEPKKVTVELELHQMGLEKIALENCQEILEGLIQKAKSGDKEAGRFILERFMPNKRKGTPMALKLPKAATPDDINRVSVEIFDKVQKGELSAEEGVSLHDLLVSRVKIYESTIQEKRIKDMERLVGIDVCEMHGIEVSGDLTHMQQAIFDGYTEDMEERKQMAPENLPIEKIIK